MSIANGPDRQSASCATHVARIGFTVILTASGVSMASAQSPPAPTAATSQRPAPVGRPARTQGGWMLEVHGGAFGELINNNVSVGRSGSSAEAFPAGTPFTTLNGQPSRAVPSWAFGDGVVLFDEVRRSFAANLGLALPAITPLDAVMRSRGAVHKPANAVGGRFSRNVTSWLAAEVAVDRGSRRSSLSSNVDAGLEATRASYTAAFQALLASIPQTGGRVTATATSSANATDTQTVVTASAVLSLVRTSRVGVHTVIGGGLMMNDGSTLEGRLQSGYQFRVFGIYPINESETVTLRFSEKKQVPVGVIGLGFTLRVAGRTGLRVDARVLASRNTATTSVDAAASTVSASPVVTLPSATTPSIQFSTETSARTTLSGAPLNGLVTYRGNGLDLRPHITVGYYVRF
jgi:hypothetical protein